MRNLTAMHLFRFISIASVFVLVLSSCSKWERFVQSKCKHNDSTYVVENTKWDTAIVYSPYEELLFDTTANEIPPNVLIHHSEKKGNLNASFTIKNSKITFKCSEDSLKHEIAYLRKQINNFKVVSIPVLCERKHRTSYDTMCEWIAPILLGFILIYVVIKAIK